MKMKKGKTKYILFSIFFENEKRMRELETQNKNLINMKIVVNYLNFVFHIEVKQNLRIKF